MTHLITRRQLVTSSLALTAGLGASALLDPLEALAVTVKSKVAVVRTSDRAEGVRRAVKLLGLGSAEHGSVFLKPNFNSSDATPGSTHDETLIALIDVLREHDAGTIIVGDRSGMGNTRSVFERKKIDKLGEKMGFETMVFDELPTKQWVHVQSKGSHWRKGYYIPKPVLDAKFVVQTCCLKTHRFGGHFTLSLKNSVGFAAKHYPRKSHNFMFELHRSRHQRAMIAEINQSYTPALVVLDGIEAFVDGGPAKGDRSVGNVMMASTDRVAIDAVGVAMLRHLGTNRKVSRGSIFEQDQLARAVELGLGAAGPGDITLVTDDAPSAKLAASLRALLDAV